ncbi:MAG: c-type cytochrome, partial [Planctomycetaceae bacterium]
GRHRDAYGNWFGHNNSNPMWHYVLDEKYISRNKHFAPGSLKHVVPEVPGNAPIFPISTTPERFNDFHTANRFTSACSTIVYDDDLFGPHFKRNAFICEPVHNLISRLVLEPKGVTFTGKRAIDEQDREFLASTDNWFRPVFVRTGPDGALWIADMYRHVIEHPEWIPDDWQKKLDLRAGHDKGRIYRVVPVTAKPLSELATFPIKGEAKELENPNRWVRDTVQRRLADRSTLPESRFQLIEDWKAIVKVAMRASDPEARIHALNALDARHDEWWEAEPEVVLTALQDNHPSVRRHGIRLSRRHPNNKGIQQLLVKLAKSPAPKETLELAYRLGDEKTPEAAVALGKVLRAFDKDAFVRSAVVSGVNDSNVGSILSQVVEKAGASDSTVRTLFRVAASSKSDEVVNQAINVVGKVLHASWREPSLRDDGLRHYAFLGLTELYSRLGRDRVHRDHENTRDGVSRIDDFLMVKHSNAFHDHVCERHTPRTVIAAIRVFGAFNSRLRGDASPDLTVNFLHFFEPTVRLDIQVAAAEELASLRGPQPAIEFIDLWKNAAPSIRNRMLTHLLSKSQWAMQLVEAIEKKKISAAEIGTRGRQALTTHRDKSIRERAEKAIGAPASSNRAAVVGNFDNIKPGDAIAGRTVFKKRCATCHQLDGVGKQIGADLTALKDKSTKALLTAILDPNRAVEAKFISYTALTEGGKMFSGMIKSESGNAITLIGSDGKEQTVLRSDIDEFSCSNKSLMPEGLEKDLTKQDLADVIAFVQSGTDGQKPKSFAGNTPTVVRPDGFGTVRLTARNCQIHGPNLVYESHFGNLGMWASKDDHAIWTVDGLKAGRYKVLASVAVPGSLAGQEFEIIAGSAKLRAEVVPTKGWNEYRQFEAGELTIEAGTKSVRLQSTGQVREYLMDLRELLLVPIP